MGKCYEGHWGGLVATHGRAHMHVMCNMGLQAENQFHLFSILKNMITRPLTHHQYLPTDCHDKNTPCKGRDCENTRHNLTLFSTFVIETRLLTEVQEHEGPTVHIKIWITFYKSSKRSGVFFPRKIHHISAVLILKCPIRVHVKKLPPRHLPYRLVYNVV